MPGKLDNSKDLKWNKMDTNIRVYNKEQKENGNY